MICLVVTAMQWWSWITALARFWLNWSVWASTTTHWCSLPRIMGQQWCLVPNKVGNHSHISTSNINTPFYLNDLIRMNRLKSNMLFLHYLLRCIESSCLSCSISVTFFRQVMSSFKTFAFCSIFCSLNSSVMYAPNTPIQFLCVTGLFCKDYLSEMNCLYSTGEALSLRFCPVPFFYILRRQQRSVPLREGDYVWRRDEGTSHRLVARTDPCWHSENDPKLFHLKVPIVLSNSLYSVFPHPQNTPYTFLSVQTLHQRFI